MFAFFSTALCMALSAPSEVFTFDGAVAYALEHHPALRAAMWDEKAAAGAVEIARSEALPTIAGSALAWHLSQHSTVTLRQNAIYAQLMITVPLLMPQQWGDWTHAKTALRVQEQHTRQVRRALAIAAAEAYFDAILAERLLTVGDIAVEQGRAHLDYAHTRLAGGVGTRLDALRADQDLAQSQRMQVDAAETLLEKQAALGVAMGFDRAVGARPVQSMAVGRNPAGPQDDIAARDDVKEALDAWRAAQKIEDDSWRDYMPTLLLRGAPFFMNPSTVIMPQWGWSLALVLSIPFYDGGARYGLAHERRSVTRQQHKLLELLQRRARSEVRAARGTLELNQQAREMAVRAALAARQAVTLATQAYRIGTTDNLAVIDAQRSDRDAATAVAMAEDSVLRARLAWLAAVGMFPP